MDALILDESLELAIARLDGAIDNFSYSSMDDLGAAWGHVVAAFAELDSRLPESLFEYGERGYTFETRPWPDAAPKSLERHMSDAFACLRQARQATNTYGAFAENVVHMQAAVSSMALLCPQHHGEIGWMFSE